MRTVLKPTTTSKSLVPNLWNRPFYTAAGQGKVGYALLWLLGVPLPLLLIFYLIRGH